MRRLLTRWSLPAFVDIFITGAIVDETVDDSSREEIKSLYETLAMIVTLLLSVVHPISQHAADVAANANGHFQGLGTAYLCCSYLTVTFCLASACS